MIMNLFNFLNKIIPAHIRNKIKRVLTNSLVGDEDGSELSEFENISYSQEGEDRILYMLFGVLNKRNGFYVDVGAHHPHRFSNTYVFYSQGWRGINIDANAESIALFQEMRPRDINVSIGVGEKAEKSTFYIFNEPALNTFDAEVAQYVVNNYPYKIIEEKVVEVLPLSQILDSLLPKGQEIDFLSVDVEGRDFDVLKSNDWSRYVPLCVLVEIHSGSDKKEGFSFDEILNSEIALYLQSKGYSVFAKSLNTIFFILKNRSIETG